MTFHQLVPPDRSLTVPITCKRPQQLQQPGRCSPRSVTLATDAAYRKARPFMSNPYEASEWRRRWLLRMFLLIMLAALIVFLGFLLWWFVANF